MSAPLTAPSASDPPPAAGLSPLGDMSSNLFAVLLVVMLALAARPSATADLASAPGALARAPLSAAELVAMLHARTRAVGAARLDLLPDRTVWTDAGGREEILPAAFGARLRDLAQGAAPVRVYVLSQRPYAEALAALRGARVIELTVPRALIADGGADWSPEFRRLIDDSVDLPAFSRRLAALLDARDRSEAWSALDRSLGASEPAAGSPSGVAAHLAAAADALRRFGPLLAALAFAGAVERRRANRRKLSASLGGTGEAARRKSRF